MQPPTLQERQQTKYVVRIIPPHKKSDTKSYDWHDVHDTFKSPTELKTRLMDTFKEKLPTTYDFQVGYHTKKGNSKNKKLILSLCTLWRL